MTDKDFKEATSGEVVKFEKEGDIVKGTFVEITESVQYKGSWAIKYKEDDILKVVFVTKVAHDLFVVNKIVTGTDFILEYLGKKETKDKKFKYNNYRLQYRE